MINKKKILNKILKELKKRKKVYKDSELKCLSLWCSKDKKDSLKKKHVINKVQIGRGLEINTIWDGYDVINSLFREITLE